MRSTVAALAEADEQVCISVALLQESGAAPLTLVLGVAFLQAVHRLHVAVQMSVGTEGFWTLIYFAFVRLDI